MGLPTLHFTHTQNGTAHQVDAYDGGLRVGWLKWEDDVTQLFSVVVTDERLREGIATAMWNYARTLDVEPAIRMTPYRTDIGDAWASTVDGCVPRIENPSLPWSVRGYRP